MLRWPREMKRDQLSSIFTSDLRDEQRPVIIHMVATPQEACPCSLEEYQQEVSNEFIEVREVRSGVNTILF
jgi:hypothetical protein